MCTCDRVRFYIINYLRSISSLQDPETLLHKLFDASDFVVIRKRCVLFGAFLRVIAE